MTLLDAIAAYRLTRLLTTDTLLHEPREALVRAAYVAAGTAEARDAHRRLLDVTWAEYAHMDEPDAPKIATLVTCRWCTGIWVGFGVVLARRARWWPVVRDGLALGSIAALLARFED